MSHEKHLVEIEEGGKSAARELRLQNIQHSGAGITKQMAMAERRKAQQALDQTNRALFPVLDLV